MVKVIRISDASLANDAINLARDLKFDDVRSNTLVVSNSEFSFIRKKEALEISLSYKLPYADKSLYKLIKVGKFFKFHNSPYLMNYSDLVTVLKNRLDYGTLDLTINKVANNFINLCKPTLEFNLGKLKEVDQSNTTITSQGHDIFIKSLFFSFNESGDNRLVPIVTKRLTKPIQNNSISYEDCWNKFLELDFDKFDNFMSIYSKITLEFYYDKLLSLSDPFFSLLKNSYREIVQCYTY